MGVVSRVVKFVEGILDAPKRTAPRPDETRQEEVPVERPKTVRQIMAEEFDPSAEFAEKAWDLDLLGTEYDSPPCESDRKITPSRDDGDLIDRVDEEQRRLRRVHKNLSGPSFQRLLKAYESRPELAGLVADVREGKRGITEALVEAGIEKRRTRVGNMQAEWIRATDAERREFLDLVCTKRLFSNPKGDGWYLLKEPGISTVPDGRRGQPTEVRE